MKNSNKMILLIANIMIFYTAFTHAGAGKPAKGEETLLEAILSGDESKINHLIAINTNALAPEQNILYNLVEAHIDFNMKKRLVPKLIDLVILQGANVDELLKKAYSLSLYLENEIKKINEMREKSKEVGVKSQKRKQGWHIPYHQKDRPQKKWNEDVASNLIQNLNDRLAVNDLIINLLKSKELSRVLIKEDLISKDVATYNIKEFFELPKGDQATVHTMKQAIGEGNLKDLAKILDDNEKNIELADAQGYTPLLQAVYTNNIPVVEFLKKKGANLNAVITAADGKAVNAFQLATMLHHDEMAQLLASYGLGIYQPTPKKENSIKEDLKREKIDVNQQFALLIAAIKNNHTQEAEKLLDPQTVNMADVDGKTPLMIAALKGNKELVKIILDMVATIQQQDKNGNTALHWAVINRHYAIARMLIEGRNSKELFIANKKQLSAYDLAKQDQSNKDNEDYELFMAAMKDKAKKV